MTIVRCIGCGNIIGGEDTNVRGGWDYTCSCGAHLFSFDGVLGMPYSLVRHIAFQLYGDESPLGTSKSIPHIEYYIGYSGYADDLKKKIIDELKALGSIYTHECEDLDCKKERKRHIEMLKEALSEDDYWIRMSDSQLAAHFHLPLSLVISIRYENKIEIYKEK